MLDLDAIFNPQANAAPQRAPASKAGASDATPCGETQALADAIAFTVRRLQDSGQSLREIVLRIPSSDEYATSALLDLSEILPPTDWLTLPQRRLWRERSVFYERTHTLPRTAAEQEAMAELVMTGQLCDPTPFTDGR